MPSLIDLRRRVRSVKNTQQITKAMKMVAASKLRRAQERLMGARPYAVQMQRVLASLAGRVDASIHPLLSAREPSARRPDAGHRRHRRQGALRRLQHERHQGRERRSSLASPQPCSLGLVGRKGRDFFGRRGVHGAVRAGEHLSEAALRRMRRSIAKTAIEVFTSGQFDRVVLVYNEFKSVMTQRVVVDSCCRFRGPRSRAMPRRGRRHPASWST